MDLDFGDANSFHLGGCDHDGPVIASFGAYVSFGLHRPRRGGSGIKTRF